MDRVFEFVGYENNLQEKELVFKYKITSSDKTLEFSEKLIINNPSFEDLPPLLSEKILNSLLLVLGISYWKIYCPKVIKYNVPLTSAQAKFWNDLYIKGLGEFFFRNNIDFTQFNLFSSNNDSVEPIEFKRKERSLLAVGGGKDSVVSGELLKKNGKVFKTFTLGQHPIQEKVVELLGVENISVSRVVDPLLLELNKDKDTYNGHVPISSIYHFVGILLSLLFDYKYIVFSNEASANYGNVEYLGQEINHQWSKSYEFEKMLQDYVTKFITPDVFPFSLLRSMNEIKIVELFSKYEQYFSVFSSCNRNFTINKNENPLWCGKCAKCLFMFCTLSAFLPREKVVGIFGKSLFDDEKLVGPYEELLGIKNHKPFDCVGTPDEVRLAFLMAYNTGNFKDEVVMQMFYNNFSDRFEKIEQTSASVFSVAGDNSIPQEFV